MFIVRHFESMYTPSNKKIEYSHCQIHFNTLHERIGTLTRTTQNLLPGLISEFFYPGCTSHEKKGKERCVHNAQNGQIDCIREGKCTYFEIIMNLAIVNTVVRANKFLYF